MKHNVHMSYVYTHIPSCVLESLRMQLLQFESHPPLAVALVKFRQDSHGCLISCQLVIYGSAVTTALLVGPFLELSNPSLIETPISMRASNTMLMGLLTT